MTVDTSVSLDFEALGLPDCLLGALNTLGYETPTPIQERTIPLLLSGSDVVGQAQTGTGKTGAFALPLLSRIDTSVRAPQVLVLAPTRELAIQAAEACRAFSSEMKGLNILPIFGGQEYGVQIRGLKKGAQLVVGTPGRVMDHIRKGTLDLSGLTAVVLDEADEMLRMGFIEDVEWVMAHTPETRQVALFSATMPPAIRRIAKKYLKDPSEVSLETRSVAAVTIDQRYCVVPPAHKTEALLRILEGEKRDGVIVFARTKADTVSLNEALVQAGNRSAALNGDLAQSQRERTVDRFKSGELDVLVATDVAARGLDVERVSHVINYDAPRDAESYVHRIGRTGRAGRAGKAILMLSPRDRRTLDNVSRKTKQPISSMDVPSAEELNRARISRFADEVGTALSAKASTPYRDIIAKIIKANDNVSAFDVAVALATLLEKDKPLLLEELPEARPIRSRDAKEGRERRKRGRRAGDENLERYTVQVGASHGLDPRHLVGAIANEADLSSKYIGRIEIHKTHSTVDLPMGMPEETYQLLRKVTVCNRPLKLRRVASPRPTGRMKRRGKRQGAGATV